VAFCFFFLTFHGGLKYISLFTYGIYTYTTNTYTQFYHIAVTITAMSIGKNCLH